MQTMETDRDHGPAMHQGQIPSSCAQLIPIDGDRGDGCLPLFQTSFCGDRLARHQLGCSEPSLEKARSPADHEKETYRKRDEEAKCSRYQHSGWVMQHINPV
ncbi:hypothetical protein BTVI_154789 [Pitangus sulphuratus]|nr:hypothetical protein BTVI_154789 [Pitangus sulphuratus]